MTHLNREIVLQTLRGYSEVNRITQTERRVRLMHRTSQESLAIFSDLYEAWEQTGKLGDGEWKKIFKSRLDSHLQVREAFQTLAKSLGHL